MHSVCGLRVVMLCHVVMAVGIRDNINGTNGVVPVISVVTVRTT